MSNKLYRNDLRGTHYLWPVWPTRLVIAATAVAVLALAAGCSSCPPCAPDETYVDNPLPVYSCPEPPPLPPLVLLPWPVLPDDPTPEQIKTWYVEVVRVNELRLSECLLSLEACSAHLDAYRSPSN